LNGKKEGGRNHREKGGGSCKLTKKKNIPHPSTLVGNSEVSGEGGGNFFKGRKGRYPGLREKSPEGRKGQKTKGASGEESSL